MFWNTVLKPILFRFDPEWIHYAAMGTLSPLCSLPGMKSVAASITQVRDPMLEVNLLGLNFPNPVGLAAGFDKDARWHQDLAGLGFGYLEVGTITDTAQPGNPKPRMFRLPADQALLNRLGFNNGGAQLAADRLAQSPAKGILGINIGKSKMTPNDHATESYLKSFRLLHAAADYITINVSSPNTLGLRELQDRGPLLELLNALQQENQSNESNGQARKPILLKIAPDMTLEQLDDVIEICLEAKVAGIIATNTTISRDGLKTDAGEIEKLGNGGISGRPITQRSRDVVRHLYKNCGKQLKIVGVGGIFDGDDAWEMIAAGASLVQVFTGFIYGGPLTVKRINQRILQRMKSEGIQKLSQLVGQKA